VITGRPTSFGPALQRGNGTSQKGSAGPSSGNMWNLQELTLEGSAPGGEPDGMAALVCCQDAYAPGAGLLNGFVKPCFPLDTDEDQERVKRHRSERVGRHGVVKAVQLGRDHCDPSREPAHTAAELGYLVWRHPSTLPGSGTFGPSAWRRPNLLGSLV